MANLAVFGLGYVGTVTAACFAAHGHQVVGVDINPKKLAMVRDGISPVSEPGLDELVQGAVESGALTVMADPEEAIAFSNFSFITVGTPSKENGDVDLSALQKVLREIGLALRSDDDLHTVVLRSTVLPGTTVSHVLPTLIETSQKTHGEEFQLFFNPEFLREGSALQDFYTPPYIIIGQVDNMGDGKLKELWSSLPIHAPIIELRSEEAEMLKYASNAFHALKIVFANEIGAICKELSCDGQRVMSVFVQDSQLNISRRYLTPGFPFGGSCLPKDLDALAYRAKTLDVRVPVLNHIAGSNDIQLRRAVRMVLDTGSREVAILGLSFKPGTDDVRNSPAVLLAEYLIGKGLQVSIFDRCILPEYLTGRNKEFLDAKLPHITRLLKPSVEECISTAETVVICEDDSRATRALENEKGKMIIDLVGIATLKGRRTRYAGIAW